MGNVFGPQIPLGKAEESDWGVICDPPKGTSDDHGWGPLLQGVWAGGVKKGQNLSHFRVNFHSMSHVLEGCKVLFQTGFVMRENVSGPWWPSKHGS